MTEKRTFHAENVLMSPPQQAASISNETIPALTAAVNAIKADALREAAEAWEDGGHDQQGTSPALWLADRSADTRANGLEVGHAE